MNPWLNPRTSYNAYSAMESSSWWTYHSAFHAIVNDVESTQYGDFQIACRGGIIFG